MKTVTTNFTSLVPGGTGASKPDNTVRLVPVGFTVTALFPCLSSTNPKMFAASTCRRRVFVAVAVNVKHTVFFLFGRYWLGGHGLGAYDTSLRPISPPKAAASRGAAAPDAPRDAASASAEDNATRRVGALDAGSLETSADVAFRAMQR